MFGDQTSFSKMIGFTCLTALSILLVSTRIDRPAFASANLAADTMKLNPTGYLTADNDRDDDDDCKTRKANYSLADNDRDDDDDCKTRKTNYSLTDNKNNELTAITRAMEPKSVKLTF